MHESSTTTKKDNKSGVATLNQIFSAMEKIQPKLKQQEFKQEDEEMQDEENKENKGKNQQN